MAEGEIRLWWVAEVGSTLKYPKRSQYKHAKQKKYHVRNRAEYNEGLCMRARTLARQRVEHRMACEVLNKMTVLGMPDTYCVG